MSRHAVVKGDCVYQRTLASLDRGSGDAAASREEPSIVLTDGIRGVENALNEIGRCGICLY